MADLNFVAIITGPTEYLEGGVKVEDFTITWDEIVEDCEDFDDEGNPTEKGVVEAIDYLKEEYAAEWSQRWCNVTLLSKEQFQTIKEHQTETEMTYKERVLWFFNNYFETGMEFPSLLVSMKNANLDAFEWYGELIAIPKYKMK
jgi:hypothetical protein